MYRQFKFEIALVGLVVVTVLAIVLRPWLLGATLVIDPLSETYTRRIYDDVLRQGNSRVHWVNREEGAWRCSLKESDTYAYPYCGHELYLNKSFIDGIDLSRYHSMSIWMRYEGPAPTVRLMLRNYNPAYSQDDDLTSTKYNVIEFERELLSDGVLEVRLSDFSVADWWLIDHSIPLKHSYSEFSNTVIFEVQTGSGQHYGEHYFDLDRIEFHRQRVTTETWYLAIIVVWVLCILYFLAFRVYLLQRELIQHRKKENELTELNQLLDKHAKNLEVKAKTDPLTGAFNRQGVEESLRAALNEWHASSASLSIVILDIDHFKSINDTYGHTMGDDILVALSALVKNNIRSSDRFARWGGEEFLLVCRNSELVETQAIAEKLRSLIATHTFAGDFNVTASFGVASIRVGESLEELFKRADVALYQAKREGRNCVIASED